jgi:uncharacterized protein (DUF58 family)
MLAWVQAQAERRLPALTRLRAVEPLPIDIHRRRIYVLPTGFGLFFCGLLFAMGVGSLNYNNNPALMLVFLVGSAVHTALLRGYLGLSGLRLVEVSAAPVHAGERAELRLRFEGRGRRARRGLSVASEGSQAFFEVAGDGLACPALALPTARRGLQQIGRIKLSTRYPLGLFVAWSWLHPQAELLVYPALEAQAPPLPGDGGEASLRRQRSPSEEVHGLREHRAGDPMRLVAWKRSAQLGRLMVREFESPSGLEVRLDYAALGALPPEQRLQRLARWLVEAERRGLRSELLLPKQRIGPGRGEAHLHAGLRALALMP